MRKYNKRTNERKWKNHYERRFKSSLTRTVWARLCVLINVLISGTIRNQALRNAKAEAASEACSFPRN